MRCARCQESNPDAARFCNQCGAPFAPTLAPAPELRRLTVIFCDLVGSVELANRLDPEDWHALLACYQATAGDAVRRQHGHVAQHLGDGLVAYFGYPLAGEDDAERAVRAALAIVQAVPAIPMPDGGAPLRVRVGLHTGATVMGHVGGDDGEYLALGDTPNIAARIQALAPANGVLLSPVTRTLVAAGVHCVEFGEFSLKGLGGTMRLHQALRVRGPADEGSRRSDAPLLGRGPELGRLVQRWQESATSGACVLLLGEPGIGKSRLAHELRTRVRHEGSEAWTLRCSAHATNTPFAPLQQFLQQAMVAIDPGQESPAALDAALAQVGVHDAALVGPLRALLGLAAIDGGEEATLSAQALRERTFAAATGALRTMAARRHTLLVVEDLHWADPTTLEWLRRVLRAPLPPGLMLLLLARTEFDAGWTPAAGLERLALEPCTSEEAAALVGVLDRARTLSPAAVAVIIERAEGNPLFLEEFTRAALEARGESIPLTLQEQTTARLDRLGRSRQVLQHAAVIGREFSRRQLRLASELPDDVLEEGLQRGVEAHMLRPLDGAGGAFAFRHALLRDAAYASLLRSARQAMHARVAEAMLAEDPAIARTQPELLAHHYTEAGQVRPAIAHWLAAAKLALSRSASMEAAAHAREGLRLLGAAGDDPAALALELELRLVLAPALMAVRGVLDPEVEQAYSRARLLCERLGNGPKLLVPVWGLWAYELMRGEVDRADGVARRLRLLADSNPHPTIALVAAATNGMTRFYQGDLRAARDECGKGLGEFRLRAGSSGSARGMHDPGVMCHTFHGLACWLLGDTATAAAGAAALREAIPQLPPFDAAYAWCSDAVLHTLAGDAEAACASSLRAIAIGKEQAFPAWQMMGAMMHGWGQARQGQPGAALVQMRRAFDAWCGSGARNLRPFFLLLLADAALAQDDAAQALRAAESGLAEAATGEHCWDPELHRLAAQALARLGEGAAALASARRGIEVAQRMEAIEWTQRGISGLNRLLREQAAPG
ncbi:MAG: adenylate/guanylate cyclase [Ramlibacter sp.]|jgi:class 3 adenylate cyclase|nr:adenylate/guanylate cyclase [Ramlibacter sp.]MDB5913874.1 adenylate/guanylate cyclase [Ramlibacter sp.]